jgi:hypothetical protein
VAFSKFDPYRAEAPAQEGTTPAATRRARILRYAWWVTAAYTAMGFVFLVLFWWRGAQI